MASLFRPVAVKPIPAGAELVTVKGVRYARWTARNGSVVLAPLTADGRRCRVKSPVWWVEYADEHGRRHREKVSRSKTAAEYRRGQIVQRVERARVGLPDATTAPTSRALVELADAFRDHLAAKGRTAKHVSLTRQRIGVVLAECKWVRLKDVSPDDWHRWVSVQRSAEDGLSAESCNHHLRAIRGMLRWLKNDPLAGVGLLNVDAARVLVRRALSAADFEKLITTTRESKAVRLGLNGRSRAALYLTAARTGLRAGVLAKLFPKDVHLEAESPHIPTPAALQKNRKAHRAALSPDLLAELQAWLVKRPAGQPLWPGNWHRHHSAAKILRRDLKAAGIPSVVDGRSYDFHALRVQCGTDLARAGVNLSVAQKFLGHSTPALTAKFYTQLDLTDLTAAASQLGRQLGQAVPDGVASSSKLDRRKGSAEPLNEAGEKRGK